METLIYRIARNRITSGVSMRGDVMGSWICGNCDTITPWCFLSCWECGLPHHFRPCRNCMCCGKQTKNIDHKYCSTDCFRNHRTGQIIPCHGCGKEIYRIPSLIHKKNYCSVDCKGKKRRVINTLYGMSG